MACVTNGTAFARKKKMTWKECCNKWGRAAMEQQQGKGSAYTTEVSRDQLAANIFAFIPTTEWHSYYVARVGLSANALKLKYAISFGEKYEHGATFNRCPECDCAIDEHYCDECEIRFKKADDNIIKNMNETAKVLGGWNNYYAATWKQFEAAKYDMEQIAPTAGMLERRAKEAEKLLGKKAKRHEIAEVQQLWEEFEAAKELEAEEETFFEHEASLSSIPEPTTYEEAFPQLKVTSDVSNNMSQASEIVEDNLGFFFGEIPAKIALPTIPILEILPAAPILNLNGELNDIAEVKQPEVIDEVCVTTQPKETDIIQSGLKKYKLINGKFQKVKKVPKTLYPWGDRETTPGKAQHAMVTKWVRKKMSEEADKEKKIWSAWEHTKKQQLEKRLDLKVKWRYGMFRLVKKTRKDNQRQRQKQRALLEQKKLEMMPQQIVSTISIGGGLAPSHMEEATQKSGMIFCTPSMKKRKLFKPLVISNGSLDNLTQAVLKIACKKEMNVEFIGKRVIKGDYTHKENVRHLRLQLKHMKGLRHSIDLRIPSDQQALIVKAARVAAWKKIYKTQNVVKGMSGFVLNPQRLQGKTGHAPQGIFVVRGAFKGVLYDARMKIGRSILPYMEQFSHTDVAQKFWKGFDKMFLPNRPEERSHVCVADLDVSRCGEMVALTCQVIQPCVKITCTQCFTHLNELSDRAYKELLKSRVLKIVPQIRAHYPEFSFMADFFERFGRVASLANENYEAFSENRRLIGDRNEQPFSSLNKLNNYLVKGGSLTGEEFSEASDCLRELVRYHNNRTENIKKGSLEQFRNKISQRSHFNASLMCDNQLDKNGNFIWGERGYHAKRFFANYFDIVEPKDGYAKYIQRKNPNGSRELAINNLIVSTNFERMRELMEGIPVKKHPLSKQCVSMRNGNFVYVCSCVTLNDGQPQESDLKLPTRNHLVIGNAGDPKYVDLPTEVSEKLYIAKEGFCYINIFLAMLVNVRESEAKDFTKRVRDIVVQKLGKWPTMIDVATACCLLAVFHPEVQDAELPRILVDHTTKTMHVIDSYGSKNTGYHILKANTVNQLMQFASDSLDSEMKYYVVGGHAHTSSFERSSIKMIIKGVYKPAIMREILETDPYMLLMAILSPTVLKALHTSGSLERALEYWINNDQDVVTIIMIVKTLAQRVSVARTLTTQMQVVQSYATELTGYIHQTKRASIAAVVAFRTLQHLKNKQNADGVLVQQGFQNMVERETLETLEKKYAQDLKQQWCALSLLQKCYYMLQYMKQCRHAHESGTSMRTTERVGVYIAYPSQFLGSALAIARLARNQVLNILVESRLKAKLFIFDKALAMMRYGVPDVIRMANIIIIITILYEVAARLRRLLQDHLKYRAAYMQDADDEDFTKLKDLYVESIKSDGTLPTVGEFLEIVNERAPELNKCAAESIAFARENVVHQAKSSAEAKYERIIAMIALFMMAFDAERSDCVYKILNKLRTLTNIAQQDVHHQSLDDIKDEFNEKRMTIDFELDSDTQSMSSLTDTTFAKWWSNQLAMNNVIPHYRTEGYFMEFTRANASAVAHEIATSHHNDILIRGAVGSGKSTGLPFNLMRKGAVLLVEPTRPLAENVCKQLRGDPFNLSPTLKMRGLSVFGSSPITIMTSGYALHYLANNVHCIANYQFIIFDECHVNDASAMAFRCLLHEHAFAGKILKVSATPPGREVEFTTQHPVKVLVEESISFSDFVAAQGTGQNADVVARGDNILVYVASYNDVDNLSKLLLERGHRVTKVDGRTMKVGSVEIATYGTNKQKHFIVATNIIENGVTLDIDVVVDFGRKVSPSLDTDCRQILAGQVPITYGERIQRLGRVGRVKPGCALRIGWTEKGLVDIPALVATEAALLCFTYGLPVMTHNVSTALLSGCTVRQARTMQHFELSPYFTVDLVRHDGTMHPMIHNLLKKYKLRDSEISLSKMALPVGQSTRWMTVREYNRCARAMSLDEDIKIPFLMNGIPDSLYSELWDIVQKYRGDVGFGRITSNNAGKIAYTLKTDFTALPRTVKIIDELIEGEMAKQEYFRSVSANACSSSNISLASALNAIKARYAKDHTAENIAVLQAAKAQIIELKNLDLDGSFMSMSDRAVESYVKEYSASSCVQHQNKEAIIQHLNLKGIWNKSLITQDLVVMGGVFVGGLYLMYESFKDGANTKVSHQGYNKRQRQKLKFRETRDQKLGREVYGDDSTIEHYFGTAYTKKGKTKGSKRGMGAKNRRFTNMYGYDPSDYSFVRFVDPLTGHTLDENIYADIELVQEHFGEIRRAYMAEDMLEPQKIMSMPGIQAYYMSNAADKALKVDMTPHNPLKICETSNTIAGFPEQESVLRQTGKPEIIKSVEVPKVNEYTPDTVIHESKSLFRGLRDYNPIASVICQITNESDGHISSTYGVGYGCMIIANQHLFKRNNGTLLIKSRAGEFRIQNSTTLKMKPCVGRDVILLQMPKDFPPFPRRLKFRQPEKGERICMVGSNFQEKSISSVISESSVIHPVDGTHFWKHWIDTKDGQCGLPIVSTKDGSILGIHSLAGSSNTTNFFTDFPEGFVVEFLENAHNLDWIKAWKYNPVGVLWGSLKLTDSQPEPIFKAQKLISDLNSMQVYAQSYDGKWLFSALNGNLKAVGESPSQLVTKHVVKGKCPMFELYLQNNEEAAKFFKPLMGAYQKSMLNKEAYKKDLFKYAEVTDVGLVDCDIFEKALNSVIQLLERHQFGTCVYITDEDEIIDSLNMKAAVGALYSGKKKEYFQELGQKEREDILRASCLRLYLGKLGVWNGSLKAELRPLEKVQANKTRTFTAAPLDTLLAGKVCVDAFNNRFYDLHIQCPWSVGMTKFYGGWDELLTALPDGWKYCDADGSQFDSSLSPYLINAVLQLRLHFMEEWDIGEQMLRNLYTEIVYTPILTPDGTIIKKHKGNNSGQPSTVVDNTLMVILAMYYSLHAEGYSMKEAESVCKFFVNGDDLLIAVHPEHEVILDKLQSHFKQLGLKYTFDDRHDDKSSLWFMSHQGIKRDNMYIPKLEKERIVSILEWDRAREPVHRMEAICAAMVEAWGYDDLVHEIRKFYKWLLDQAPYSDLAKNGGAPYIAEVALRKLYTSVAPDQSELERYLAAIMEEPEFDEEDANVHHQADETIIDTGKVEAKKNRNTEGTSPQTNTPTQPSPSDKGKEVISSKRGEITRTPEHDRDINTGTLGTFQVPRLRAIPTKIRLPLVKSGAALNLDHLLVYKPSQLDITNAKATRSQFNQWYEGVKNAYEVDDQQMSILMNGLVVWCIENGTSPNINGDWVMMDGDTQVSYPIKPLIDFAAPTFRQIMKHFSDVAEAYIQMRNAEQPYMPRYGLQRNLTDMSLARYAFDFYEVTSRTPIRAKEAYFQMKAAALTNTHHRLFGLDGNVSTTEENTERHTATDVDRNIHTLLGMRGIH